MRDDDFVPKHTRRIMPGRRIEGNRGPNGVEGAQAASRKRVKSGGRKKGVPNRITVQLKEAVLLAANERGEDGKGKDGLVGYLRWLARMEPRSFATLLGRVIPLHITGVIDHDHRNLRTKEEVMDELKKRGLPVASVFLADMPVQGRG